MREIGPDVFISSNNVIEYLKKKIALSRDLNHQHGKNTHFDSVCLSNEMQYMLIDSHLWTTDASAIDLLCTGSRNFGNFLLENPPAWKQIPLAFKCYTRAYQ
jgi:hypothetical protein